MKAVEKLEQHAARRRVGKNRPSPAIGGRERLERFLDEVGEEVSKRTKGMPLDVPPSYQRSHSLDTKGRRHQRVGCDLIRRLQQPRLQLR